MIAALVFTLLILVLLVFCYKNAYKRPKNFPPGPPSLPVYGAYWIILAHGFEDIANAYRKLGEKYKTKIVGCNLASTHAVVINDPSLIREMLSREEFDGRMDLILFRLRSFWKKLGVFFTDGYFWHVQRRFSLRYLRDFGFGRRDTTLETVIEHEIKDMLDMRLTGPKYPAEKEIVKGDLVCMPDFFTIPFANGLLQVLFRSTLPRAEQKELRTVSKGATMFQQGSNDLGGALSLTPWLKNVLPNYSGYNSLVKGNKALLNFFEKYIKEAVDTYDARYNRHFIDVYLAKMEEELNEKDRSTYSEEQLLLMCTDYMLPASSALQNVLIILVERLLLQPEIQEKIHEEIDHVVGRDRLPTLDDRHNMPYVEACIRETMRYDTIVPLGVPHRAMKDTSIGGYDIPENTMVGANFTMLHTDKSIWGDPENFRPERFITNGRIDPSKDKSLPFSAGRRLCAGETYARQSMFQVFSAFMQTFKVSTPDGKQLLKPSERITRIITVIPKFWVRLTPRLETKLS